MVKLISAGAVRDIVTQHYIYLIDRARGPYGGILVEFSFYVFMDRAAGERHVKRERDRVRGQ